MAPALAISITLNIEQILAVVGFADGLGRCEKLRVGYESAAPGDFFRIDESKGAERSGRGSGDSIPLQQNSPMHFLVHRAVLAERESAFLPSANVRQRLPTSYKSLLSLYL